ncbi:MAG TPA: prolipoprotein diacylglyceryl transferase [Ktedonobacteraceae bacterium]|jgi:phosphatidylglycerol:prolipoprotein diacylglycerol transferase|nr:prolipoprotein diacylglyceryl transferase [Ktedonobacteraceae bacterium]
MYPPVSPILIQLGPLAIHWYGLTMTLAIFTGTMVASSYVGRKGQDPNNIWEMLLWVLIPALVGARLYFVFIQTPPGPDGVGQYLANPIKIIEIWDGGIHIYGAIVLGGIAGLLFLRIRKLPVLIYLDGIGLGLLIGQAIGRIGNFINQELYGPPTTLPWGLRIDPAHRVPPYNNLTLYPESVRFQPLFLYELIWDALGFAVLYFISRRFKTRLRNGDLFLMYLIWFPTGRFFIEFMRSDSWFFPGTHIDLVHILSALTVITSASILILRHRRQPAGEAGQLEVAKETEDSEAGTTGEAGATSNGIAVNSSQAEDQRTTNSEIGVDSTGANTLGIEKG